MAEIENSQAITKLLGIDVVSPLESSAGRTHAAITALALAEHKARQRNAALKRILKRLESANKRAAEIATNQTEPPLQTLNLFADAEKARELSQNAVMLEQKGKEYSQRILELSSSYSEQKTDITFEQLDILHQEIAVRLQNLQSKKALFAAYNELPPTRIREQTFVSAQIYNLASAMSQRDEVTETRNQCIDLILSVALNGRVADGQVQTQTEAGREAAYARLEDGQGAACTHCGVAVVWKAGNDSQVNIH
ncbi:hypothetical protein HK100_001205 [Physocladia obscura]|uniref:Uncharacterized protein n=1 Tax=Physocladia obscura TaxID=109957 RepID=A0AAD5XJR4_9FUNG|nr:hypothetical protein HK100_001205 [Physocladia obscura]